MAQSLRAGTGKTDITPAMGIQLAGDIGRYRPAEELVDRLYARALVLEGGDGGRRICLLSLDVIAVADELVDRIRAAAAKIVGCEPMDVFVHALQAHSTPELGCVLPDDAQRLPWLAGDDLWWLRGGDERYNEPTIAAILQAVTAAAAAMQPVSLRVGRRTDGRVAFNRRFIMRDGSGKCHPARCSPDILCNEGPVDPEVGVAVFEAVDGTPVAALLHHTCHPCHFYPLRKISADWPGAWCDLTEKRLPGATALVLNGFVGNIHHTNHLDPDYTPDHRRMAAMLDQSTGWILQEGLRLIERPTLATAHRTVTLSRRRPTAAMLADAKKLLTEHPEPIWLDEQKTRVRWDWCYAVDRVHLDHEVVRQPTYACELQAIRLGDLALLGAPGEPFVEAQLHVKTHSPAPFTFCAHMTKVGSGYMPTREAYERGGYETDLGIFAHVAPGSLETMQTEAVKLLARLWD